MIFDICTENVNISRCKYGNDYCIFSTTTKTCMKSINDQVVISPEASNKIERQKKPKCLHCLII